MINLNQVDINVRLQILQCCIGTKAAELLVKIKIGAKDVNCKLLELQVLQGMFKAVKCYNILSDDVTEEDNCLTEEQAQAIFSYMQNKCSSCFQFPGVSYTNSDSFGQFDDSFDESFL